MWAVVASACSAMMSTTIDVHAGTGELGSDLTSDALPCARDHSDLLVGRHSGLLVR